MKIIKDSIKGQKVIDELRCNNCGKRFIEKDKIYPFHNSRVLMYFFKEFWRMEVLKTYHKIQKQYSIYFCQKCFDKGLK